MHKLGISVYPEHSTPEKIRHIWKQLPDMDLQRILHACYRYKKQRKK